MENTSTTKRRGGLRRKLVEAEILERAAERFAEQGYAATRLQQIADDLDLNRASLYHYFKNKEEMLDRLVSDLVARSESAIKAIGDHGAHDPPTRLKLAIQALIMPIVEAPNSFRLLLTSEVELPAELAARWREIRENIVREVSSIIAEGVQTGQFRSVDAQLAAFTVLGMCNWVAWWPSQQREAALHAGIDELAVAGLLASDTGLTPDSRSALRQAQDQLKRVEQLMESHPELLGS